LRGAQGFCEVCESERGKRPSGEVGQPAEPDAIAEDAIGQLRFDVLTNAEGIRLFDEQVPHLGRYLHNELTTPQEPTKGADDSDLGPHVHELKGDLESLRSTGTGNGHLEWRKWEVEGGKW
jgi:hypothetical protein